MWNVANTLAAAYTVQARPSQNALCYCLGYLQHALARNTCTFVVQNLGMLLGHPKAEKVLVIYRLQWLCQFPQQVWIFSLYRPIRYT